MYFLKECFSHFFSDHIISYHMRRHDMEMIIIWVEKFFSFGNKQTVITLLLQVSINNNNNNKVLSLKKLLLFYKILKDLSQEKSQFKG